MNDRVKVGMTAYVIKSDWVTPFLWMSASIFLCCIGIYLHQHVPSESARYIGLLYFQSVSLFFTAPQFICRAFDRTPKLLIDSAGISDFLSKRQTLQITWNQIEVAKIISGREKFLELKIKPEHITKISNGLMTSTGPLTRLRQKVRENLMTDTNAIRVPLRWLDVKPKWLLEIVELNLKTHSAPNRSSSNL